MGKSQELRLALEWAEQKGDTKWGRKGALFPGWGLETVPRTLWPSLPAEEVSGPESPELCGAGKAPGSSRRVAKGKTVGRGSSLGGDWLSSDVRE